MMSRKGSKIEIILTTEWEIGARTGRQGQQGLSGDSPWDNVGLMLVILEAVELRREAMRTVERMSADDVLSCGIMISKVTY